MFGLLLSDRKDSIILSLILMYIFISSFNTVRLQITTSKLFYTSEVLKRRNKQLLKLRDTFRRFFRNLPPYPYCTTRNEVETQQHTCHATAATVDDDDYYCTVS